MRKMVKHIPTVKKPNFHRLGYLSEVEVIEPMMRECQSGAGSGETAGLSQLHRTAIFIYAQRMIKVQAEEP